MIAHSSAVGLPQCLAASCLLVNAHTEIRLGALLFHTSGGHKILSCLVDTEHVLNDPG